VLGNEVKECLCCRRLLGGNRGCCRKRDSRAEVWGHPAALAVAKDGSLLVADDTGGTIWRIAYTGKRDGVTAHPDETKKNDANK